MLPHIRIRGVLILAWAECNMLGMDEIRTTIGRGGRINIPAEHRRALGLYEGEEVLVGVEEGVLTIQTREAAIDRVQKRVRERIGEGRSLSEELIADRRREAAEDQKAEGAARE